MPPADDGSGWPYSLLTAALVAWLLWCKRRDHSTLNHPAGEPRPGEEASLRALLGLVHGICISSWLDVLRNRPSDNWYTRSFKERFAWFLKKHHFQLVANVYWFNLAQLYLRAKWVTLQSPDLTIRFTYLVNEYQIEIKPVGRGQIWRSCVDFLPDFSTPDRVKDVYGIELQNFPIEGMIEFIDEHWAFVTTAAAQYAKQAADSFM